MWKFTLFIGYKYSYINWCENDGILIFMESKSIYVVDVLSVETLLFREIFVFKVFLFSVLYVLFPSLYGIL